MMNVNETKSITMRGRLWTLRSPKEQQSMLSLLQTQCSSTLDRFKIRTRDRAITVVPSYE
ncbi:unnamed protein product [Arabidopsis halleri]